MNEVRRRLGWLGLVAAGLVVGVLYQAAVSTGAQPAAAAQAVTQPARAEWPMWGGSACRNNVSLAKGIPAQWDVAAKTNIKWVVPLGSQTYGGPVVAGGKIFVGTNNGGEFRPEIKGDKGCVLCFDEATGKLLWQATHDKLASGPANDWPEQGVASTPLVEGDRVYYVSNRCELVCADVNGFRDGKNDGPFTGEKHTGQEDADFIWILDMIGELGVFPRNLAECSPVVAGDLIFVCTSNGTNDETGKPPKPEAPSFIAVNKNTGKVVWKRNDPGGNVLHGQWSSPAYGVIGGRGQVVFGGGDGWCYAFEPLTGEPIWKFELNPKDSVWKIGGSGTKTSIVATPVIWDNRVFLASGDDPENTLAPGHLYAIDAKKTGDITESGKLWHVGGADFSRTVASVAVADGLVYAVDLAGFLSCFDATSGERYWRYDVQAAIWGSPCVVDGKVMVGNVDGEVVVLEQGKTLKELARNDMHQPIYTTPVAVGDTLYIATQKKLYAIGAGSGGGSEKNAPGAATGPATTSGPTSVPSSGPTSAPVTVPENRASAPTGAGGAPSNEWPMFRGNSQLTGVAGSDLPAALRVRWKYEAEGAISSTAAIAGGVAYVGSEKDVLYAINLADGKVKWEFRTKAQVDSSPTVIGGLAVFGDDTGTLHACDAGTGALRWEFKTGARIISSANVVGENFVFGSYDGALYCVRIADGGLVWKFQTEDRVHSTPAISEGRALFAGCDGKMHVVKLADGTAEREVALGSVSGCSAAVRGPRAYVGTYGEEVLGIDWQTGQVVWRFAEHTHEYPFLSSAALTDKLVLIGGRDKRLHALDAGTGKPVWEFATKGEIDSSPVVVGEHVFFGSGDGKLYAVSLADGKELWRYDAGSPISASPAVGEGCLVIGTEDGVIHCFEGETTAAPGGPGKALPG